MRVRRPAAALLGLGLALGVAGCGGHSRRPPTIAGVRVVYTSLPTTGPYAPAAEAVYDGEELALAQAGGMVRRYKVELRRLDDGGVTGVPTAATVAASAHVAAGDANTIAYLGDLVPGSSGASIPILSQAGILQISPGDTATGLAGATFARVVPPVSDEATAQLVEMGGLMVKRLYLVQDRTTYGRDLAAAVESDAPSAGIDLLDPAGRFVQGDLRRLVRAIKRSKADGLLYAGSPTGPVGELWNALATGDPTIKKFASASITLSPAWALTARARYGTYLSAPGLPSRALPRAGLQFESDFGAAYPHAPWTTAVFGYLAMSGVLQAMYNLGAGGADRARVAQAFLRARDVPSALGAYSISQGETSFDRYFFTTFLRDGAATLPAPPLD